MKQLVSVNQPAAGETWINVHYHSICTIKGVDVDGVGRTQVHYDPGPGLSTGGEELSFFLTNWRLSTARTRLARLIARLYG